MKARTAGFIIGVVVLCAAEALAAYWVMPFPGSQTSDTLALAYALHRLRWPLRVLGVLALLPALRHAVLRGNTWSRVLVVLPLLAFAALAYGTNMVARADRMFQQPHHTVLVPAAQSAVDLERVVLGVEKGGQARAYPIELLGYHHQVQDTLAGTPLLVTYCTVCRTGRVYTPVVQGQPEHFRLVGMDHFNAMFEDERTGSWWRQVNGAAVAGPLTGTQLPEVPSEQVSLRDWLARHPQSLVLQPDPDFEAEYAGLRGYDDGSRGGALTGRSVDSWQEKSWVVGVSVGGLARAYDWNQLVQQSPVNDRLGSTAVLVWASPGGKSFAARERTVEGRELTFTRDASGALVDAETSSVWDEGGRCTAGPLQGKALQFVQSHQDFWHAWRTFSPGTDAYRASAEPIGRSTDGHRGDPPPDGR